MLELYTKVRTAVAMLSERLEQDERGMESLQLVGIVVVAAIIVVALIGQAGNWGTTLANDVNEQIQKVTAN